MAQQDFSLLLSIAPDAPKAPTAAPMSADEFVDSIAPALVKQESGGKQLRPDGTPVTSPKGAIGMWQVMPGTAPEAARLAGVEFDDIKYRTDADYNSQLGRAYLKKQLDTFQDPAKALAAYNAGPGAVSRALATAEKNGTPEAWLQYLPRETQAYVPAILNRAGKTTTAAATQPGSFSSARPMATSRTTGEAVLDNAIGLASGVVTGAKLLSDVFGADNAVSQTLGDANKALVENQSQYRQDQRAERAATVKAAEASGSTWEEVKANVGAFLEAPLETSLNALGTSAPTLLMSVIPGLGQAQAARLILQGAAGAAQGVGAAKSGIYDAVREELIKTGKYSEDEAAKIAAGAQAYDSDNAGNIALNGLLGVVAGTSGIEAAASRIAGRKAGQEVTRGIAGRAGMGVVKESPVEGVQGGFERYTSNVALQNEGFDVDPMQGVVGQGALEAVASAPGGAAFGALDTGAPTIPPALKPVVDKAAEPNSPLSRAALAGNAQALAAPSDGTTMPPGGTPPTDPRGPAADDLVQRVRNLEEGMRNEGWLDNLRLDGLDSRDVMLDMALARNTNAPRRAREEALERIETAVYFANRDAPPAAPMDSIQNNPDFDFTQPEPSAPREVPSLAPVEDALRDPALRGQISDTDRQQLLYLYNLAGNTQGENNVRVNAAQQALEIVGRYQAPTGTPNANSTPALEQRAPADQGIITPESQQNVGEPTNELDFMTTAPAPKVTATPAGDTETPAFLRRRGAVVKQLVDNGFETVARDGRDFYLTNTKTGQKFKLDGPADAQIARKTIKDRVDALANTAAASPQNNLLEPTAAQIAAGNYKKSDVIDLNGMRIKIENPQGSVRRGTSPDGTQWETKMAHHYGEFQGTTGADGDKLDVFVGPRPDSSKVFVIDQVNQDGSFDEHKVMMGFTSQEDAQQGYLANYEPGWTGMGAITEMSLEDFRGWSKSRAAKKPVANLAQPQFTAQETSEDPAQPGIIFVNDGQKRHKLRILNPGELQKKPTGTRDGPQREISQGEAKTLQMIAGLLGRNIVFYDGERDFKNDGFVRPGDPGTIFVKKTTSINPLAVFGHEFFHTLRESNAKAWDSVAAVVSTKVADPQRFRKDYYGNAIAEQKGNEELSRDDGGELEELISDLGGNLLKDAKFWGEVFDKIAQDNGAEAKGIIAKLAASIQRAITRLVNGINQRGFAADDFVKDLDQIRAAFRDAMAQHMQSTGVPQLAMAAEIKKAEQQLKQSPERLGALTVTGYHFSQQPRSTLSTSFYGTGLKGSAREEIMASPDARLRERLSFYFDKGAGVRPEAGVGGIAHKATLTNIYDADADPLGLRSGNARAFESKVLDAGYSGYLSRLEGTQPGQIILLGKQTVTPEVLGPRSRIGEDDTGAAAAQAPALIKRGLMSREIGEINVSAIPGATLRAGMLTVPPESVAQANAELERIGSTVRLSPEREDAAQAQREYAEVEARYKGSDQWLKAPNGNPTNLSERQWVQVRTPSFKNWFGDWEAFAGQPGGVWADGDGKVSKVVDANGEPKVVYHGASKGGFMSFKTPGGTKRGDLGIFTTADEGMAESYVRRNRVRRVEAPKPTDEQTGWRYIDNNTGRTLFIMNVGDSPEDIATREQTNGAKAVPIYGDDPQAGDQPGVYALFVNIRNPNESDFEGANWDGTRYEQYQVVDQFGDPVYAEDGRTYLPENEARALAAANDGAEVQEAPEHYENTDSVVREARRLGSDGAIIRQVMDDGGGTGYSGEPADVFVAFDPNQVKSADFNSGSYSLDLDDIRLSRERGAILDIEEATRFSRARPDRKVDPRHVPEFKFKDFIGRFLFATIADRTAAGGAFTGIDGAGAEPIPLQGGPGFPLLSRNFNKALIWANEGPAVAGRKKNIIEEYGNPLMAVSLGELDMHKSNATAVLSYLRTLEAYIKKGRVQIDALDAVTDTIRSLKLGKDNKRKKKLTAEQQAELEAKANELSGFPGFRDLKKLHDFVDGATFDARAAIVEELGKARSEEIGLPSADKVIRKLTDPEYAGARHFDTVLILEPHTEDTFIKLGEDGTDKHLSYSYALKGKVVGKLRVPINAREIWSDWWRTQYQKKWDEKQRFQDAYKNGDASKLSEEEFEQFEKIVNNEKKLATLIAGDFEALISMDRAFALSMPVVQITPDLAARLDAIGAADAPNAATARAAVAFMNDDWATSDTAKNKGGTSSANFARELRQSDAAATLDLYSEQELVEATRGWKWGEAGGKRVKQPVTKMRLFQLRGQRIQFALKYGKPYTYGVDVPGLTEDEVTLTSVVNNEPGVSGVGGPAIMLKAIAEGATFLDAYSVKSERFPDGFLPTLYNEYGFEEVGRVPADPQYITDDHRYAWRQHGWKEGDALPDIVMMKWKGSDEQRTGLLERYLREGAASLRRGESSGAAKGLAGVAFGQGAEAQRTEPNPDRGAGGDPGTGDRASLASRAFKAVAQLRSLTDDQLRNLGVDPAQVRKPPPESTLRLSPQRLTSADRIKWRDIQDVKSEIALDALPQHITPFADFMKFMAQKAAVGAISPRDVIKAYTITRSSVNRGAISLQKALSGGLQLPRDFDEPTVRPEGAFAYWLLSEPGQDYLNDAELGIVNQAAIDDAVAALKPFGMSNTLGEDMARAVTEDIGSLSLQVSHIVNKAHAGTNMVSEWQRVLDNLYGIGYAKKGFMGAMLGYGQLPTFDARQINVQVQSDSRKDVLNALGTARAPEVVDTLAKRLDALDLTMDEEYLPFKQHLVHHAVWDAAGKSETTHQDVVDAMLRASVERPAEQDEPMLDEVPAGDAKGLKVTYEVEVQDTGSVAKLTVDAGDALSDYDQRIDTMKKLLECLSK